MNKDYHRIVTAGETFNSETTLPERARVSLDDDTRLDRLDELGRLSTDVDLVVAGRRHCGQLRRRHLGGRVGGGGRCGQDGQPAAGLRRAGRVARDALEPTLIGRHAVDDRQPAAPGRRVAADGEVLAGVDAALVVVPGDRGRRVTADDAAQRHLGTVASRHVLQPRRERRRCTQSPYKYK